MITELSFSLATDPTESDRVDDINRLRVRATDSSGERLVDESYRCIPSIEFVSGPLFASGSILEGESVTLFDCSLDDRRIAMTPTDGQVTLDIRALPSGERVDVDRPVPVSPDVVVEAVVEFAATNLAQRRERADSAAEHCYCLRLEIGIDEARNRLSYDREHGTQKDYEPTLGDDHFERFLFDCRRHDHLAAFVAGTDALDAFVRDLRNRDDEYADDAYRQLLEYHDEVCEQTLAALRDEPGDERATLHLENVCWAANPDLSPVALDALAKTDRGAAVDVAATLVRNDEPDVATAAAELLADVGAEAIDERMRTRIDTVFEQAVAEADGSTAAELSAAAERFRNGQ
jgi:hypothetical protein